MKSEEEIRKKVKFLKQKHDKACSPLSSLIYKHEIEILHWVLRESYED